MSAAEKKVIKHNQTFSSFFLCGCTSSENKTKQTNKTCLPQQRGTPSSKKKKTERGADKEGEYHLANIRLNWESNQA
jgi:hypothetical protein